MQFGPPKLLLVNEVSTFTGEIIHFIVSAISWQIEVISPFKHGSLGMEKQTIRK